MLERKRYRRRKGKSRIACVVPFLFLMNDELHRKYRNGWISNAAVVLIIGLAGSGDATRGGSAGMCSRLSFAQICLLLSTALTRFAPLATSPRRGEEKVGEI